MQDQFTAEGKNISMIGVNQFGFDSSNDEITLLGDLPWLQEEDGDNVWASWSVTYRDVIILDKENKIVDVFNLTNQDLENSEHFSNLKDLFERALSQN